jgi:uncharacterized OB-fold protein
MTDLVPQAGNIPLPYPGNVSRPFWDGCADGILRFQRCPKCGRAVFNPAPMCRWCGSLELQWEVSAGTGAVYSWTVVWRPQSPAFHVPYAPAIIDIEEGYQMLSCIIGCAPDEIHSGLPVRVEFHPVREGISLPYFRPLA